MNNKITIKKLSFKDVVGAGKQIYAHIDTAVPCAEFTMKGDCEQPIVNSVKESLMIMYEPWIQFKPESWDNMLQEIMTEMVDLWNEKHAPKEG